MGFPKQSDKVLRIIFMKRKEWTIVVSAPFQQTASAMLLKTTLLVALALAAQATSDRVTYDGHKLFRVTLKPSEVPKFNADTAKLISTVIREPRISDPTSDFESRTYFTDVLVAPANLEHFNQATKAYKTEVTIEDAGAVLAREALAQASARAAAPRFGWTAYNRYDEIVKYCQDLAAAYPIATTSTIGKSTEGRDILMIRISKVGSPANKSAVLIDGGFHAREWISPAVATFIIGQLVTNPEANAKVLDLVDVYVVPVVNPDGYEYSHTTDRLWRKTRSKRPPSECFGTDPNRNFDFKHGGEGTSPNPCSEIYHGDDPFSEPETAALRDVFIDVDNNNAPKANWKSYLTLHSYAQMWLTPWSWTDDLPEDFDDMINVAKLGAEALTGVYGTKYQVNATTQILYKTAGCSDDWAKDVAKVKYANTLEVRDVGRYGFELPPEQILPTAIETWNGIRAVLLSPLIHQ